MVRSKSVVSSPSSYPIGEEPAGGIAVFPAASLTREEAQLALRTLAREDRERQAMIVDREAMAEAARIAVGRSGESGRLRRFASRIAFGSSRALQREIRRSGLFLDAWYDARHECVGGNALGHFVSKGLTLNLAPNPFFDPEWYRRTHGLPQGEMPFLHYLRHGAAQALAPGPLFDATAYLRAYPELATEPDLLAHYLRTGIRKGCVASPVLWP